MRLFAFARLSTCVLLCLCPVVLGHCGGATKDGLMGTETGNPPVVDSQKLRLVAGATGVELIAEPGAVSAGASVRLENRSTGEAAVVTASADGSFRMEMPGAALDTYEVTVTYQGGTVTLQLVVQTASDGTTTPGTDPSTLSCEQLESSLTRELTGIFTNAAASCQQLSDCHPVFWTEVGCYQGCNYSYVASEELARMAGDRASEPLCSELERRSCPRPTPGCPLAAPVPECDRGTCREVDVNALSCDDLRVMAQVQMTAAIANSRGCSVDADCVMLNLPLVSCTPSCPFGGAVTTSAAAGLQQTLELIEDGLCNAHRARSCAPPDQLPCAPPPPTFQVTCRDNLCEALAVDEQP